MVHGTMLEESNIMSVTSDENLSCQHAYIITEIMHNGFGEFIMLNDIAGRTICGIK